MVKSHQLQVVPLGYSKASSLFREKRNLALDLRHAFTTIAKGAKGDKLPIRASSLRKVAVLSALAAG